MFLYVHISAVFVHVNNTNIPYSIGTDRQAATDCSLCVSFLQITSSEDLASHTS